LRNDRLAISEPNKVGFSQRIFSDFLTLIKTSIAQMILIQDGIHNTALILVSNMLAA
jgi:hypothetical protein